jgi:hypothetical protein
MRKSETEVFLACKRFLETHRWTILGGEAPGGSAHVPRIEIHHPSVTTRGSGGSRKVDLIAYRDGIILLLELKPSYDRADVLKLDALVRFPSWRYALVTALDQRRIFERYDLAEGLRKDILNGTALVPAIGLSTESSNVPDVVGCLLVSDSQVAPVGDFRWVLSP